MINEKMARVEDMAPPRRGRMSGRQGSRRPASWTRRPQKGRWGDAAAAGDGLGRGQGRGDAPSRPQVTLDQGCEDPRCDSKGRGRQGGVTPQW